MTKDQGICQLVGIFPESTNDSTSNVHMVGIVPFCHLFVNGRKDMFAEIQLTEGNAGTDIPCGFEKHSLPSECLGERSCGSCCNDTAVFELLVHGSVALYPAA